MAGLKDNFPEVAFGATKVTADEIDVNLQYVILHPSVSASAIGTAVGSVAAGIAPLITRLDYPRNVLLSLTGGTVGGTLAVNGQNQFGGTTSESIVVAVADGGTTAGTMVFARVGTMTWSPVNSNNGTINVGYAIGTTASSPLFGLPIKLGGTTDIKAITWVDSDVTKIHTADAAAVTRVHAFKGTAAVDAADSYVVTVRSTFNTSGAANQNTL